MWLRAAVEGRIRGRVPDLVFAEVASALLVHVRVGASSVRAACARLRVVLELPLEVVPLRALVDAALALAVRRG